jgi:hypothetical protein
MRRCDRSASTLPRIFIDHDAEPSVAPCAGTALPTVDAFTAGRRSTTRGKDIGVDDPDQIARIHVELTLDRGQGDVHNRVVEQNHALGDAHRGKCHDPTSGTERLPSHT